MALDKDQIARTRMMNQWISAPVAGGAPDAVRWLGAVQAQDFTGSKWGVGLRLLGVKNEQVEQAFSDGLILRTHLMRPTWHFVTPEDIRWLLALTAGRVRQKMASTDRQVGIDDDLVRRCNRSFVRALEGGRQLTRDDLRQVLEKDGIDAGSGLRMGNLVMRAELDGVVCSGPRKGKQFTYMLLEERAPQAKILEREESLAELARRFFLSRGPATAQDFARWSGLTVRDARIGLDAVKGLLTEDRWNGVSYWLPADVQQESAGGHETHLMSVYDEYISGYQDRSAMVDPAYVERLRGLGNGLLNIVVLDRQVVGAWRRTESKEVIKIELNLFRKLEDEAYQAVNAAGKKYGAFFGKEVEMEGANSLTNADGSS